jgi:hypothetical protein
MRTAQGRITAVQEGRFLLVTPAGRVLQMMLSHRAAVEPQDLPPLEAAANRVRVEYRDSGHLIGGVVERIQVEE